MSRHRSSSGALRSRKRFCAHVVAGSEDPEISSVMDDYAWLDGYHHHLVMGVRGVCVRARVCVCVCVCVYVCVCVCTRSKAADSALDHQAASPAVQAFHSSSVTLFEANWQPLSAIVRFATGIQHYSEME